MGDRTPAVVVVDPQTPGNVGTIARAMKNFGFEDLILVDAPPLPRESEAYGFAGQAREDVLPNATRTTLDAVREAYFTVGLTAITGEDARRHVRFPFYTPDELADELRTVDAPTALVFGREDSGLTNEELAKLDAVCAIPASEDYPVLNLGQAATVTLYELRDLTVDDTQLPDVELERAEEAQLERLYDRWAALLDATDHPEEKREKTMRMLRRIFGRAHLTEREAITLLGVLRRAERAPGDRRAADGASEDRRGGSAE
jgi:TrmH family RNA methyltransferase